MTTEQVVTLRKDRIKVAAGSEGEVEVFTEREVNQLLFFVQDRSKVSLRNHLIVWLLLYTGVRVSELCGIQLSDLDYLTNTIRVTGKGGIIKSISVQGNVKNMGGMAAIRADLWEECQQERSSCLHLRI